MKISRLFFPALALFLAANVTTSVPVRAETYTLPCKTTPTFLTTIKRSLESKIEANVNQSQFSDARATVQLKLLSLQAAPNPVNSEDLVAGLAVLNSGPTGLSFAIDGNITFAAGGTCLYTYRVVVLTRARDLVTGDRILSRTDSIITLTTPPYGTLKKN